MILKPLADMGWAAFIFIIGFMGFPLVVFLTVLVESAVIWKVLNSSAGRAFKEAIVMNLASGILGFVVFFFLAPYFASGEYAGAYYDLPTQEALIIALLGYFGPTCLISIAVEGPILSMMEKDSPKGTVWLIAVSSNLASYAVMFLIAYGFFYNGFKGSVYF